MEDLKWLKEELHRREKTSLENNCNEERTSTFRAIRGPEMISKSEAKLSLAMALIRSKGVTDVKSYVETLRSQLQLRKLKALKREIEREKRKKKKERRRRRKEKGPLTTLTITSVIEPEGTTCISRYKYDVHLFDAYLTLCSLKRGACVSVTHLSHAFYTLLDSLLETLTSGEPEVGAGHLAIKALTTLDGDFVVMHGSILSAACERFLTRFVLDAGAPEPDSRERALKVVRHVASLPIAGCRLRSSVALASLGCLRGVASDLAQGWPFSVSRWENSSLLLTLLGELVGEGEEEEVVRRDCRQTLFDVTNDCLRLLTDTFPLFVHAMCQLNDVVNRTTD